MFPWDNFDETRMCLGQQGSCSSAIPFLGNSNTMVRHPLIEDIDRHSMADTFSTHDPGTLQLCLIGFVIVSIICHPPERALPLRLLKRQTNKGFSN